MSACLLLQCKDRIGRSHYTRCPNPPRFNEWCLIHLEGRAMRLLGKHRHHHDQVPSNSVFGVSNELESLMDHCWSADTPDAANVPSLMLKVPRQRTERHDTNRGHPRTSKLDSGTDYRRHSRSHLASSDRSLNHVAPSTTLFPFSHQALSISHL